MTNMPQLREHVVTFCSQPENNDSSMPCLVANNRSSHLSIIELHRCNHQGQHA
jgi:hypothetical protein